MTIVIVGRRVPDVEPNMSWQQADAKGMELTPKWNDIPEEFKRGRSIEEKLFFDVFFGYVALKNVEMAPRPGVDRDKALKVLNLICTTMGTGHEHKTAGWAYLCHEWFVVSRWARREGHQPWK